MEDCQITRFPNGLTLVSENLPYVKSFSLGFWFNVGSRDENHQNNGISHFLEHMFFKGTKKRTAKRMSEEIESLGGYLNAFTTKDHTCYYGRGLARHIEKTFDVLSDMLQNSLFEESEIQKEADVIIDEMHDIEDSPEELIFDKIESNIYKGNALELPIIGSEKTVKKVSPDLLRNHISKKYGFNNFFIVASGAVEHKKLINLVEKYIDKDFGKAYNARKHIKRQTNSNEFIYKDIQQAHLILARSTYGLISKKSTSVSLLSHILGDGSSSRLFQRLREKNGIAYQINSFVNFFKDVSSFGVYFSTKDQSVERARELIIKEFKKLRNKKISEKELNRAKEYLKGSILISLESTTNRMMRIANSLIYYGKVKTIDESIKKIDEVTTNDIFLLSNELLDEDKFNTVVISSKNHLLQSAA